MCAFTVQLLHIPNNIRLANLHHVVTAVTAASSVMFDSLTSSSSTSKLRTSSLVSSVPFLLPTAQTSFVLLQRILHTTPPLPPLSSATKLRKKSPPLRSQIFTEPSSEDVITNFLLNCRHVTALWCLLGPEKNIVT